jgi:hypothetical protein
MKGIEIHKSFKPAKCSHTIDTPALTLAAGSQMGEINLAASKQNLTVCSGGGSTVGVGGYLTGGGHSAISATVRTLKDVHPFAFVLYLYAPYFHHTCICLGRLSQIAAGGR